MIDNISRKIKFIIPFFFVLIIITSLSCNKDSFSNPESFKSANLDDAFNKASQIANIKSLVVWQNGNIIRESFFNKEGPDALHDVRSVTKSVISILIGIAIDKKIIPSVNQSINNYLSPLGYKLTEEQKSITIQHLLTMSSGFQWSELISVSEYNNWATAPNQVQYLLNRTLSSKPGEVFSYNSAALHLLSVILTQASGISTIDFANKYLFNPLETSITKWETDNQEFINGAAGLNITPYDMIKIGQLIINKGLYKNKRIVSEEWIENSTSPKISTNNATPYGTSYCCCWWGGTISKYDYVFANGWGGQFIVIIPSLKLVVTATNKWSGIVSSKANEQWMSTLDIIMKDIVPKFY